MNGAMDFLIEMIGGLEGSVGQTMTLEVAPASLDVVEFGRVFRQPLDGQPRRARGERLGGGLAGVDRAVVEDQDDGSVRFAGLRRVGPLERAEQVDLAGAGLLPPQREANARARDGVGILPALQRVAGAAPGEAPLCRNSTLKRPDETVTPIRRVISPASRGK